MTARASQGADADAPRTPPRLVSNPGSWNTRVSKGVYDATVRAPVLRAIASVVTLTVDEIVHFPLFCAMGYLLYWLAEPDTMARLAGQQFLHSFSDIGALCFVEQVLKAVFRMPRPPYMPRKGPGYYVMPFEWYCFPSGHTARGAYIALLMIDRELSPLVSLWSWLGGAPGAASPFAGHEAGVVAAIWVAAVAWSRVALAKHYLLDVVAGAALGAGLFVMGFPTLDPQGPMNLIMATCFTLECIAVMCYAPWRRLVRGWPWLVAILVASWGSFRLSETSAVRRASHRVHA